MGGDLNLKKSWHPSLMSNQKKVWEQEQQALEERKKIDQIRKEREEERQIQELQELQEAAGGKKRQSRVDWMYQGPSTGQTGTTEENEAFLLGKRRVDTLLQGREKEALQKNAAQADLAPVQNVNVAKDAASKIRDDPLLAIKKQEQAAYEAMMNDPVKRRMLLRAAGKDEDPEPDRKRRKHHHSSSHRHHDRHRDRDRESERHPRNRSLRDDSRERRDRHRRRSYRDRSPIMSRSASPDPNPRRSSPISQRRRSRSRSHSRSQDARDRSRSPYRERSNGRLLHKARSWHNTRRNSSSRPRSPPAKTDEDERLAKLAAMQQDASELDSQRQQRLQELADRDNKAAADDDRARLRNAKYGGRADFVNGFHRKAGDQSLSERMGRKRYTERGEDS